MKRITTLIALLAACALPGCGGKAQSGGGTNTNWVACASDWDCSEDEICSSKHCVARASACSPSSCNGACEDGRCITEMSRGSWTPSQIAVDSQGVYWHETVTDHGRIVRAPLSLTEPEVIENDVGLFTVANGSIYWTLFENELWTTIEDIRSIFVSPAAGGPKEQLAGGLGRVIDIEFDEGNLYSTSWRNAPARCEVTRWASTGGVPVANCNDWRPVVRDGELYGWESDVDGTTLIRDQGGKRVALAAFPPSGLPSAIRSWRLVVDDTYVFFADASGNVLRVPRKGGELVPLATGLVDPVVIAVDDVSVYVTVVSESPPRPFENFFDIGKIPRGGGPLVKMVSSQLELGSFALDETSLYWASWDKTVKKVSPK